VEPQKPVKKIEFISKKTKNFISFSKNGIKIPENLSSMIIEGKISDFIAKKILFKENKDYFFKFDKEFFIKTFYNLRNRKYTIKLVRNRKYSIIGWSRIFYFPILKFEKLDYAKYKKILQILEEINGVSDNDIKKAEDSANLENHTMIIYRYVYLIVFSVLALFAGLFLFDYLTGNERVVIEIYNIIIIGSFLYNMLMVFLVGFWGAPSDIKKMRIFYILQYIEGLVVVIVISAVFTFALTR
jgi:hypothetical protein